MAEPPAATSADAAASKDVLLATKLHTPRSQPGFVPRPRLLDWLDRPSAGHVVSPGTFVPTLTGSSSTCSKYLVTAMA